MAERELPLSGVRVADFFWMIAGPLGSRVLANYGAEVIRIESSNRIDRVRETGPHPPGPWSINADGSFQDCNSNKLSISLNLNTHKGIEIARRLVAVSDVVTNNFTGTRMDRWGLGYDELSRIRPDLIMLTMPVFGMTGPYARYGGYGNGISAGAGLAAISGYPDEVPFGLGSLYPDFSSNPFHAVIALLSALHYRSRSGRGQFIEISQFESTAQLLGTAVLQYTATGESLQRMGNRHPEAAPHGAYPCMGDDRWIAISVMNDDQWQELCTVMGRAGWAADPRLNAAAGRLQCQDEIDEALADWTGRQDAVELMHALQAADVPAGVVQNVEEMVYHDPQLAERDYYYRVTNGEGHEFITHGEPVRLRNAKALRRPAPLFGEHTEYVLHEVLGMGSNEVAELYVENVLS